MQASFKASLQGFFFVLIHPHHSGRCIWRSVGRQGGCRGRRLGDLKRLRLRPEWSIETTTPLPGDQRTPASQCGAGRKSLTRASTVTLILGSGACDRGQSTVIGASSNGVFESTGTSRPQRRLFFFIYLLLGLCSGAPVFEGFGLPPGRPHPVWATVVDLSSRSMFNLFGV